MGVDEGCGEFAGLVYAELGKRSQLGERQEQGEERGEQLTAEERKSFWAFVNGLRRFGAPLVG